MDLISKDKFLYTEISFFISFMILYKDKEIGLLY